MGELFGYVIHWPTLLRKVLLETCVMCISLAGEWLSVLL